MAALTLTDILRLAQSGARGFTTGLLGAPVDIANTMLGGVGGPKPVMGGEWIGDKLQGMGLLAPPATDLPNAAAEFAGGLLNPGGDMALAAKAAAGTKGLLGAHIVFHGSPHTFDKFDMGKIGTGEGAQAYGHGLYFADNPKVATEFAGMSSGHLPKPSDSAHVAAAQDFIKHGMDPRKGLKSAYPGITERDIAAAVAEANGGYKPNIYKVDIPDEAIGRMLDWDKPLSEQPQAVREAVKRSGLVNADGSLGTLEGAKPNPTGEDLLRALRDMWNENLGPDEVTELAAQHGSDAASQYLKSLGIPGIRYLDQGSRASGKGTYNTVLFDADLAKILGRE